MTTAPVIQPHPGPTGRTRSRAVAAALLLVMTLLAYFPAWHGSSVWDDDAHITKPELRSWGGLRRIWLEPGATQQYYPLLHSSFWLQHKLLGDSYLGYHLVNIALHALCALLLWAMLVRLGVAGAFLAAAVFALHPIEVESVAWISERKNVLSGAFCLASALCYVRFDEERGKRWYFAALDLFVLGLLSKTVIATLPAVLLVVFWWKRGRISLKRDLAPLLPLFAIGVAAGAFTAYVERTFLHADASLLHLSPIDRVLIAGRAVWFYLGKLAWPVHLTFIYPLWQVSAAAWWQYFYPATALATVVAMWSLRRRSRAPLAAALAFVGALFPALGFFNVYPFAYSFVTDHFQYLAGLAVIVPVAALVTVATRRCLRWLPYLIVPVLAILTWRQCGQFASAETLYRATLKRNPDSFLAHNNLGMLLSARGRTGEAIREYQEALRIKPDDPQILGNLAAACAQGGENSAAIAYYFYALRVAPDDAVLHNNVAVALESQRRAGEAIVHYRRALEINPRYSEAYYNLGLLLASLGRLDEAMECDRGALQINPDYAAAHYSLGVALAARGKFADSIKEFEEVLRIQPDDVRARENLARLREALHGR